VDVGALDSEENNRTQHNEEEKNAEHLCTIGRAPQHPDEEKGIIR
jgi:hypothetical protein